MCSYLMSSLHPNDNYQLAFKYFRDKPGLESHNEWNALKAGETCRLKVKRILTQIMQT